MEPANGASKAPVSSDRSEDASRVEKWRKSISDFLVLKMELCNLDSGRDWNVLLKLMSETLQEHPDTFLLAASHPSHPPNDNHAFSLWTISCLLRVLPYMEGSLVTTITDYLHSFLQLSKSRDHAFFVYLLQEFIQLSSDVAELLLCVSTGSVHFPVFMSHFSVQWEWERNEDQSTTGEVQGTDGSVDDSLSPQLMELHQTGHTSSLLQACLQLLEESIDSIVGLALEQVHKLFEALCTALEIGTYGVKECSLSLLAHLLERKVHVMMPSLDRVIWCVIALVTLMGDWLNQGQSVPDKLQRCTTSVLEVLFSPSEGEPQAVLRFWDHLMATLYNVLCNGAYPKFCSVLQSSIGKLAQRCCLLKPENCRHIGDAVMACIGKSKDLQPLVAPLFQVLKSEVLTKKPSSDVVESQDAEEEMEPSKRPKVAGGPRHLSRKTSNLSRRTNVITLPEFVTRLVGKAVECLRLSRSLCSGEIQCHDQLVCTLEGVRVVMELFAWWNETIQTKLSAHWLSTVQLGDICTVWESCCRSISSQLSSGLDGEQVISIIVNSIGALCTSAVKGTVSSIMIVRCLWIVSLPWIQDSVDCLVTGSSSLDVQMRLQIKEAVVQHCSTGGYSDLKCSCLRALSVLSSDVALRTKLTVFEQALRDPSPIVSAKAVMCLAVALTGVPKDTASGVLSGLRNLKLDNEPLLFSFVKELPSILLSLTSTDITREHTTMLSSNLPLHHTFRVKWPNSGVVLDPDVFVSMMTSIHNPTVLPCVVKSLSIISSFTSEVSAIHSFCLDLFTHNNIQVRNAVSKHIRMFFPDPCPKCVPSDHPVINKLKETFKLAAKNHDIRLQEFVVLVFGQIARFGGGILFETSLIALLKFVLEPSSVVRAAAFVQVEEIAASQGLVQGKLLSQYKELVCQFLVDILHDKKELALAKKMRGNMFYQVALAFGLKDLKQLFEAVQEVLVPLLVCRASVEASEALAFIGKATKTSTRSLLLDCFKFIFLHLVRSGQQKDINTASKFLEAEVGVEMTRMLRMDLKNVLNLLLLHLSTHRERVLAGIKMLAEMSQSAEGSGQLPLDSDKRIVQYLEPHLHGIIAFLNFALIRLEYFTNSNKGKLALSSLMELMQLMGPAYFTRVKMKILAILRHCLTFKDEEVIKLSLSAWNCFVHSVELEALGPILGQVVVALSPFVEMHPKVVSEIFNFLIIDSRAILSSFFDEIYLVPDGDVLQDMRLLLAEHTRSFSFHDTLRNVLKGVCHEQSDVRLHALKALHKMLKENKAELQECMVGNDTVDPIITEIITALLRGLRGCSVQLKVEYGRCLGELGAIDPGRLDIPIVSSSRSVRFYDINGDFCVDLLNELARAYLGAKDTRCQDCCAYAIQEVLRIFDCGSKIPKSEGALVWSKIPPDNQEVFRPHLSSSYSVTTTPNAGKYIAPIFKPEKNISFHEWVQRWCTALIHKLDDSLPKTVFLPCSLLFQHDIGPALYMLPYVMTCTLQQGTPIVLHEVYTEVMAVLHHSSHHFSSGHTDSTLMCTQIVFSVLDHLTAWTNDKRRAISVRKVKGHPQRSNPEEVDRIASFLEKIPKDTLAMSAYHCQAYTRALMYLEQYLLAYPANLQKNLGFLQKIYVALEEADSVAGVAAIRITEPQLSEQILQYECTGDYRDAAACYERAIQLEPNDVGLHEGLLRSMMRQGEFTSALMHVNGIQAEKVEWMRRLNAYRIEASWKLGQWSDLEQHLKLESYSSKNWDVNLGRLLLAAKQRDFSGFYVRLSQVQKEQMGPLCTASLEQGSYQRGYEYIVRLHMLQEMASVPILLDETSCADTSVQEHLLDRWIIRLKLMQESFRAQEPVLSLRRVILGLKASKFKREIGQYWLQSAKIARRAGHSQTAHSFLLNASDYSLPEFSLEKAEWVRNQGASHEALLTLQKYVQDKWPEASTTVVQSADGTKQSIHAEALLLIGRWMEDTSHYDTQTILKQYKSVISVHPESEDGHFYLGKYYDRLMSVLAHDRLSKSAEFLHFIVRHYGHALEYGIKYIYQCMPRMLSLWLDFSSNVPDSGDKSDKGKRSQERGSLMKAVSNLNSLVREIVTRLPSYQFLIVFAQLISRICHPNSDVFNELKGIVLKLLEHYPQQVLWMMIAINKSTHEDRQKRCRVILDEAKKSISRIGKYIDDMIKLCDRLLEVCNKPVEQAKTCTLDTVCRGLARLTSTSGFSSIMVPLQSSLNVTLPTGIGKSQDEHNPFPGIQPTIVKFEDKVEVLSSLQKPKKVTVLGSDGKHYILLCKPKDDLRKDARLMEFNSIINKCLRKDHESRQRRLYIRTFAVVPLNEACGLLEWVSSTHGLRNILTKLYIERGKLVSSKEIREMMNPGKTDPTKAKDIFLNQLLPRHPSVFGEWFLRTFPDPAAWYSSRLSYAHTTAVMSMVGYILGLGDRHGENILFDSTSGDCVHVDFSCLFNKGETFEIPEVVPFRLTHNITHGMGVTGYEGVFRKSCEATMKIMRQEREALLCVLRTFIHDPLLEWAKPKGKQYGESGNDKALKIVKDIEERLQGKYKKSRSLPLSVEGHVHVLIKEATDVDNLCRMYFGWAPFL